MNASFTGRRMPKNARKYSTQCKVCKLAIYADEASVWLTKPMGLSHVACAP